FYEIPKHVKEGSLDMLITKPVSLQFLLTLRRIDFSMILSNFLGGLIMVIIAWERIGIKLSIANLMSYILLIISGVIIAYSLFLLPQLLSFWIIETKSILMISHRAWEFNTMPMVIYSKIIQRVGIFFIPIIAISNFHSLFLVDIITLSHLI